MSSFTIPLDDYEEMLAAKDAEIARWIDYSAGLEGERSELISYIARLREALARCEAIARAHDLGTPEGARIADGIAALTRSLTSDFAQPTLKQFEDMEISALGFAAPDPAEVRLEAMRAKCEATLRGRASELEGSHKLIMLSAADELAALKGKGEWK